ncbi:hypothetical protein P3T18_002928 [Paraburkholderia sp. GAS199]|uniref:hypothetical protein n=1 Tax=Paraburkholderia sp. GAS199 TaxID=3035126 RepID=UPI003D22880A
MKLRLWVAVASAVLFLAPKTAGALDNPQTQAANGQALMQNANQSAQATTDMSYGDAGQANTPGAEDVRNVSYGGTAAGHAETGGPQWQPCSGGPQCKVYFGQ